MCRLKSWVVWSFWNMSLFVRSIAVLILVAGLAFAVGCESANFSNRTTNVFSWPRAEKEPEQASRATMDEILRRDRVAAL